MKKKSFEISLKKHRSGEGLQQRGCAAEREWPQSESTQEKWESTVQARGGATGGQLLRRNIGDKICLTGVLLKASQGKEILPGECGKR